MWETQCTTVWTSRSSRLTVKITQWMKILWQWCRGEDTQESLHWHLASFMPNPKHHCLCHGNITYRFGVHWVWAHNLSMISRYVWSFIMPYQSIVMAYFTFIITLFIVLLILFHNQRTYPIWQSLWILGWLLAYTRPYQLKQWKGLFYNEDEKSEKIGRGSNYVGIYWN